MLWPAEVIKRAQHRLLQLEKQSATNVTNSPTTETIEQFSLFDSVENHPVINQLQKLDPDNLSPRQALDAIFSLKKSLNDWIKNYLLKSNNKLMSYKLFLVNSILVIMYSILIIYASNQLNQENTEYFFLTDL